MAYTPVYITTYFISLIYSYTLSVRVANVEPPQLTAMAVVRIRVLDQNDNAPVFHNVVTGKTRIQMIGGDFVSLGVHNKVLIFQKP